MDYDLAVTALGKIEEHLTSDEFEAIGGLVALFEPYDGDDREESRLRDHCFTARCSNCDYQTPMLFAPAELSKTATTALRLSQCPRCFCTTMTLGPKA